MRLVSFLILLFAFCTDAAAASGNIKLSGFPRISLDKIIGYRTYFDHVHHEMILNFKLDKSVAIAVADMEAVKSLNPDFFLQFKNNELIVGLHSTDTGLQLIKNKKFEAFNVQGSWLKLFFGVPAYATPTVDCRKATIANELGSLSQHVQSLSFEQVIEKCDFNFDNLITKQIEEMKKLMQTLQNSSLSDFVNSTIAAIKTLWEIIPKINEKIIGPLAELWEKVPPLAEKLICEFTEQKVGDVFMAAATGGAGLAKFATKSAIDITEFAQKVYKFTNNGTAAHFVFDLQRRGKLNPTDISRLAGVTADLPADVKNKITKRWHGFPNHDSMRTHIDKHRREMGFKNDDAYLESAHRFAKHVDKNTLVGRQADGSFVKWNTKTDEFVVVDSKGSIVTYYKQTCRDHSDKLLSLVTSLQERRERGICRVID